MYYHLEQEEITNENIEKGFPFPQLNLPEMIVAVNKKRFSDYLLKELSTITSPLKELLRHLKKTQKANYSEKKNLLNQLSSQSITTLVYCAERSVEALHLPGFRGKISSHLQQLKKKSSISSAPTLHNIPKPFLEEATVDGFQEKFALVMPG